MAPEKKKGNVFGGHFYGRMTEDGPLVPVPEMMPDLWICRRVADFPNQQPPAGGALAVCSRCQARIVYDQRRHPRVPVSVPKICMQCAKIKPLPIEEPL